MQRLRQVIERPALHRVDDRLDALVRGDHNDQRLGTKALIALIPSMPLIPGRPDVHENEIGRILLDGLDGGLRVQDVARPVGSLDGDPDPLPDALLVVHDEDASRRSCDPPVPPQGELDAKHRSSPFGGAGGSRPFVRRRRGG